jgi:hypothetical protein
MKVKAKCFLNSVEQMSRKQSQCFLDKLCDSLLQLMNFPRNLNTLIESKLPLAQIFSCYSENVAFLRSSSRHDSVDLREDGGKTIARGWLQHTAAELLATVVVRSTINSTFAAAVYIKRRAWRGGPQSHQTVVSAWEWRQRLSLPVW